MQKPVLTANSSQKTNTVLIGNNNFGTAKISNYSNHSNLLDPTIAKRYKEYF